MCQIAYKRPQTEKLLLKSIEEIENVAPRFIESKKLDEQKARYFYYILEIARLSDRLMNDVL
jgi:hypothetical protein